MENFTFMWPCIVTNNFIIKPTRCSNFTNLFWHENLHVSGSSYVLHQGSIHCTFSKVISHTAFEEDQDGTAVPFRSCLKAVYKRVCHIPLLSVQWINSWWWTQEMSETCRVPWQNKFVKLVHLVDFVIKKFDWEFHSYHKLLINFHSFHYFGWISTHSLINICMYYVK
jgi:hypothetical protein